MMDLKSKFGFIEAEQILSAKIRNNTYPVLKAGNGVQCLLICLGTPSFRTLAKEFTDICEIYSCDTYWVIGESNIDHIELTMETIVDDIKALGDALNLKDYIIFAHSAYGIVALEFVKKYPNIARGIIMVGTPVNSNLTVLAENQSIFENQADPIRQAIDAERRAHVEKENLNILTPQEQWSRQYIYRDAARYWYVADFDCTVLWKDVHLSALFLQLFNDILPKTNVLHNLEKIQVPVYLAAGVYDYDCCPWMWKEVQNLPKNFTLSIFDKSGHWPHYEEAERFDMEIKQWMSDLKTNLVNVTENDK